MEALNTAPRQPILSIQETVALMAKRPGITTGGGIERNTPNPDPKAAEPPVDENDVVADHRIRDWWERQLVIDRAAETYRKKVSVPGSDTCGPACGHPLKRRS